MSLRPQHCFSGILVAVGMMLAVGVGTSQAAKNTYEDTDIQIAVERNLYFDESVPYNRIDVSTKEGIVTLTGTASSLYSKEKAVRQAKSVKGVRAVVDQIDMTLADRKDSEISQDVSTALLLDPATDSFEIEATVSGGFVTLTGMVQSWAEKNLAEEVARGVRGVKGVTNDIRLRLKTERPDPEIQADIEQRFKNDVWLTNDDLNVEVQDSVVKLSGTVGSALEKTRATADAYVLGVKSVENKNLQVDWWALEHMRRTSYPNRTDEEIKRAVKDAFLYDPRVWSFNPLVTVRYGVVTLTGVVDNLKAKIAAERDAENTVGVKVVKNYLKVRPVSIIPDATIAQNIRSGFSIDPLIERIEIRTSVHNGIVYLHGTVDTYSEKWRAQDIASRTNGVIEVKNHLVVDDYWNWVADWEIKDDIENQLWWSPFVDANEVNVSVEDGVATLKGTVDSYFERSMAVENALEGGARSVIDDMIVEQG